MRLRSCRRGNLAIGEGRDSPAANLFAKDAPQPPTPRDCPRRRPAGRARRADGSRAGPRRQCQRQLDRPRPRLRPRRRDERLRRLRLRPAGQGLPLHPRPLLLGDRDRHAAGPPHRPRPARHLRRGRRLQRRQRRLRPGARPEAQLPGSPRRKLGQAAQLRRQAARRLRSEAARGRGRRQDRDRRRRQLPRRPGDGADRKRGGLAQRRQRAPRRPVREGRDPERVAALLAGGASCGRRRSPRAPSPSPPASAATASTSTPTPAARSTRGWKASTRPAMPLPTRPAARW